MRRLPSSPIRFPLIFLILIGLSSESPAAGRLRGPGGSGSIPLKAQRVELVVIDGLALASGGRSAVSTVAATPIVDAVPSLSPLSPARGAGSRPAAELSWRARGTIRAHLPWNGRTVPPPGSRWATPHPRGRNSG